MVASGSENAVVAPHASGAVVGNGEGKEAITAIAPLSRAVRLEIAFLGAVGAVGAYVMHHFIPLVGVAQRQHNRAGGRFGQFVTGLNLKVAVHAGHFLFKVNKVIQQRRLRKLRVDDLVLQLQHHFGDMRRVDIPVLGRLEQLPELMDDIGTAADEFDGLLGAFKQHVVVHSGLRRGDDAGGSVGRGDEKSTFEAEERTMIGRKVLPVAMARAALEVMSDRERIAFATEIVTGIQDARMGGAIAAASDEIGRHGHMLCRAAFEMECG